MDNCQVSILVTIIVKGDTLYTSIVLCSSFKNSHTNSVNNNSLGGITLVWMIVTTRSSYLPLTFLYLLRNRKVRMRKLWYPCLKRCPNHLTLLNVCYYPTTNVPPYYFTGPRKLQVIASNYPMFNQFIVLVWLLSDHLLTDVLESCRIFAIVVQSSSIINVPNVALKKPLHRVPSLLSCRSKF